MRTIALAFGSLAAAWVAAPVVEMAVRGTTDQQTVAGWRASTAVVLAPVVAIPAPRSGEAADRVSA